MRMILVPVKAEIVLSTIALESAQNLTSDRFLAWFGKSRLASSQHSTMLFIVIVCFVWVWMYCLNSKTNEFPTFSVIIRILETCLFSSCSFAKWDWHRYIIWMHIVIYNKCSGLEMGFCNGWWIANSELFLLLQI